MLLHVHNNIMKVYAPYVAMLFYCRGKTCQSYVYREWYNEQDKISQKSTRSRVKGKYR